MGSSNDYSNLASDFPKTIKTIISDNSGKKTLTIELPAANIIGELLPDLVNKLQLPSSEKYEIHHKESGDSLYLLDNLHLAGVSDGDTLILIPRVRKSRHIELPVKILVVGQPNNKNLVVDADLPADTPFNDLVPAIVSQLGLPSNLRYEFSHEESGRLLKGLESLNSVGAANNDTLLLKINPSYSHKVEMTVVANQIGEITINIGLLPTVPINRLIPVLLTKMELPKNLKYGIEFEEQGRLLESYETLESIGAKNGDTLRLVSASPPEIITPDFPEEISVTLLILANGNIIEADLPANTSINDLVPAIVSELGLPSNLRYELRHEESGEFFLSDNVLNDFGVKEGDRLSLFDECHAVIENIRYRDSAINKEETLNIIAQAKHNRLEKLDLSATGLTALPGEIGQLSDLKVLDLGNNQLDYLPSEIQYLSKLSLLILDGNPLQIPQEILHNTRKPAEILGYYFDFQATQERKTLSEAKVLLVGEGGVGKTSLVKRLLREPFDPHENKTEGINIDRWWIHGNKQIVRLNIWDFGGQEIMHSTHQFFLTKRSLYILVIDARQGGYASRLEHWLKVIQAFGGDAPIIVVSNKCDQHPPDLDERGLYTKYPTIKAFVSTSCLSGEGISELRQLIADHISQLDHIHIELPANWFTVKEKLENLEVDYIPYAQYETMCYAEGITDKRSLLTLISFLHDLGAVLNFQKDLRLHDTNILNPDWVTQGVYKILNSNALFQNGGVLDLDMLSQILNTPRYPKNKHLFIIDMMRKFELCFDFEGFFDERFLVPDLLPKQEPYTGDWQAQNCLCFQYHYNVLPGSVISRFIVRSSKQIHKNTYWRNGVVLTNEQNLALVKADLEERTIVIFINGETGSRRNFLATIRAQFDYIHSTIAKLVVKEKVPILGYPEAIVDYQHLLTLEEIGQEAFVPNGLREPFNVKVLLDGIDKTEIRKQNMVKITNQDIGVSMIKILFLAANPSDTTRLRLDEESRSIDQALRQTEFRDKFEIRQHWAVRVADLQAHLLRHKPDIVHFSGHGSDLSGIVLEDGFGNAHPVSTRALAQLFSVLNDNVRCVILNACYSELQAQIIAEHIDCVIGMSKGIGDNAAISFATAFYQALGYGKNVQDGFKLGCIQIDMEGLEDQDVPKLIAKISDPERIKFV